MIAGAAGGKSPNSDNQPNRGPSDRGEVRTLQRSVSFIRSADGDSPCESVPPDGPFLAVWYQQERQSRLSGQLPTQHPQDAACGPPPYGRAEDTRVPTPAHWPPGRPQVRLLGTAAAITPPTSAIHRPWSGRRGRGGRLRVRELQPHRRRPQPPRRDQHPGCSLQCGGSKRESQRTQRGVPAWHSY